jgi:hypothetical protein
LKGITSNDRHHALDIINESFNNFEAGSYGHLSES